MEFDIRAMIRIRSAQPLLTGGFYRMFESRPTMAFMTGGNQAQLLNPIMTFVRKNSRVRRGFTLVEVMIVVVCMAILTAVVIPQFTDSAKDARTNTAKFSLHEMRAQLELYRQHHNGLLPGDTLVELTVKTNFAGVAGTTSDFMLGPYCLEIPVNPLTRSAVVRVSPSNPPTASGAEDAGWLYHRASGGLWIDDEELLSE